MKMIKKVKISNFRSIKDAEIELAPMTILFGENGCGKSSLFYALLIAKNVALSPKRPLISIFNLGFIDLGGFDGCVPNHNCNYTIEISCILDDNSKYEVLLRWDLIKEKSIQAMEYLIKKVDIVSYKRGFIKSDYALNEDEVADALITNSHLVSEINIDLEKIFNKKLKISMPITYLPAIFRIIDENLKDYPDYFITNAGAGINQVVYMLAKIYNSEVKTILIQNPEAHLHPSIIRKLVRTFCSIIEKKKKQLIITTHSEVFMFSLLASVRRKDIKPEEIKCYLVKKENGITRFEEKRVNEKGQIEGGLTSFLEDGIEEMKVFFKDNEE